MFFMFGLFNRDKDNRDDDRGYYENAIYEEYCFKILHIVGDSDYVGAVVRNENNQVEVIDITDFDIEEGIDSLVGCYVYCKNYIHNGEDIEESRIVKNEIIVNEIIR